MRGGVTSNELSPFSLVLEKVNFRQFTSLPSRVGALFNALSLGVRGHTTGREIRQIIRIAHDLLIELWVILFGQFDDANPHASPLL